MMCTYLFPPDQITEAIPIIVKELLAFLYLSGRKQAQVHFAINASLSHDCVLKTWALVIDQGPKSGGSIGGINPGKHYHNNFKHF